MDIAEAINKRMSVRAFRADIIPKELLKQLLELAVRAPSWGNTQPWEFIIVTGKKLEQIKQALADRVEEPPTPDLPRPREFPEPYDARRRALGMKLFEIKGIQREDRERRKRWLIQGQNFFEAPCVIYLCIDRSFCVQSDNLNAWAVLDCGLIAENIMLLATGYGLGTIAQMQAVTYPGVLRNILAIPDSKLIVLGIAIGYPDWEDPVNQFRSEREKLEKISTWYGFD